MVEVGILAESGGDGAQAVVGIERPELLPGDLRQDKQAAAGAGPEKENADAVKDALPQGQGEGGEEDGAEDSHHQQAGIAECAQLDDESGHQQEVKQGVTEQQPVADGVMQGHEPVHAEDGDVDENKQHKPAGTAEADTVQRRTRCLIAQNKAKHEKERRDDAHNVENAQHGGAVVHAFLAGNLDDAAGVVERDLQVFVLFQGKHGTNGFNGINHHSATGRGRWRRWRRYRHAGCAGQDVG